MPPWNYRFSRDSAQPRLLFPSLVCCLYTLNSSEAPLRDRRIEEVILPSQGALVFILK